MNGLVSLAFALLLVLHAASAGPYYDDALAAAAAAVAEDDSAGTEPDYADAALDNLLHAAQQKRTCVRRNGNCDHRPHDCCFSSSCRCNLWGSNCRCQREGIFQKFG